MRQAICSQLPAGHPWRDRIHWFDTLDSTNTLAKSMAKEGAPHGTVILAGSQSAGRGRMGRSFHSPAGDGIYCSVLLRPDCLPRELMHLTCAAAVAACDAVEAVCGVRPAIKWINDLVLRCRKVGGILTELGFTPNGRVDYAVIGIGINCNQAAFPRDLADIAASLSSCTGRAVDVPALIAALVVQLESLAGQLLTGKASVMERYRADCLTIGRKVQLHGALSCRGAALDVDDDGGLLVLLEDGTVHTVQSGEVSVRGLYTYV